MTRVCGIPVLLCPETLFDEIEERKKRRATLSNLSGVSFKNTDMRGNKR